MGNHPEKYALFSTRAEAAPFCNTKVYILCFLSVLKEDAHIILSMNGEVLMR
jgi:hypothetical protein